MPDLSSYRLILSVLSLGMLAGCTGVEKTPVFTTTLDKLGEDPVTVENEPEIEMEEPPPPPESTDPEEPLRLPIERAVFMALENNRELRVQRLGPVIAGAFEEIERGQFDPEIFANLQTRESQATETDRAGEELRQFQETNRGHRIEAGVRQTLPTGTDVEVGVQQTRSLREDSGSREPANELQTTRLGLSVTQSLLQGFGGRVNLARIRQAELDTLASRFELRGFLEALVADVEIAYWRYQLAREEVSIYENFRSIAEQQLGEIQERIEVGSLAEKEGAVARAEVALRNQDLIDARGTLEIRRLELARLISPDGVDGLDTTFSDLSSPKADARPIENPKEHLTLAQQKRADLNEARLRLQQDRIETVVTRNGLLPQLDLFFDLGTSGYGDTYQDSYEDVDGKSYDAVGGIRFSHYLGNRAAEGAHSAALANRRQSFEALRNLEQIVALDVRTALSDLERTRLLIDATRTTRELQQEAVTAEDARFEVGTATALDVALVRRDLLQREIEEARALINYRIALTRLYRSEGSLLERRGIILDSLHY